MTLTMHPIDRTEAPEVGPAVGNVGLLRDRSHKRNRLVIAEDLGGGSYLVALDMRRRRNHILLGRPLELIERAGVSEAHPVRVRPASPEDRRRHEHTCLGLPPHDRPAPDLALFRLDPAAG